MQPKVKYKSNKIDVVDVKGKTIIKYNKTTVGILPYTLKDGLLDKLGILEEWNPSRPNNYSYTIITGTVDPEDIDYLSAAKRELYEEGGIKNIENDDWVFLGSLYLSKGSDETCNIFGVNVTDLALEEPKTDGSKAEEKSKFKLMDSGDAITLSDEALLLSGFLRLFDFFYQNNK